MTDKHRRMLEKLKSGIREKRPGQWIRVGMDSGGMAAGAEEIHQYLREEIRARGLDIPVMRTGSYGKAHLDPVVEVKANGLPPVLYGMTDKTLAGRILDEHLAQGKMIDGHIVGGRNRGKKIESPTRAILVRDTGLEGGGHTEFLQACFVDELKARKKDQEVQVLRTLDFGLYDEGLTVELFPSGVLYTHVLSKDFGRIVEQTVISGKLLEDLHYTKPDPQVRIVLRNCGIIDPESLDHALMEGAYEGLVTALCSPLPGSGH